MRKIRSQEGLSQPALAARCQRMGWDLSRDTLAKIELQSRWVSDFETVFLAQALSVQVQSLLPHPRRMKSIIHDFVTRLEISIS